MSAVAILSLSACAKGEGSNILPDGKYSDTDYPGKGYTDQDYLALKHLLVNLNAGESKELDIESYPASYALTQLEFVSKNSSIATVDANGVVTGVSQGYTDIEVNSKDGSFSNNIRVIVSKRSSAAESKDVIDPIKAEYAKEDHVAPKKVIRYEYSVESYECEGVRDHAMESYEIMAFDAETGYFSVEGPTAYFKTPYGDPEVKDGKWIFYPINQGIKTRLIHITSTAKNYFDINTAAYSGDYEQIIRDIMNFFFVSGEKILDNQILDPFDGASNFKYIDNSDTLLYAVDDKSILYELTENGSDTTDADDEINYYDIPADTWGGAQLNPYGLLDCYCDESRMFEYGFKPSEEELTINVNGVDVTKTYYDWAVALDGTGAEYSAAKADKETRLTILAAVELALCKQYRFVSVYARSEAYLMSYKVDQGVDEYVPVMGYGGIRYYKFNYSDAEWADYIKNNKLDYRK